MVECARVRVKDVPQEGRATPPGGCDQGSHRLTTNIHDVVVYWITSNSLKPSKVFSKKFSFSVNSTIDFEILTFWKLKQTGN